MSGKTTKRMLKVYEQVAGVSGFFARMFQSPPENFYDGEEVEYDIVRSDAQVSIAVTNIASGYRMNAADIYTNKTLIAPVHKEAIAVNSVQLMKRMPGDSPFKNPEYRGNLLTYVVKGMVKVEDKIRRAIEIQASQVLQTGTVTLTDENGLPLYTIDYKPKATHFPTSSTTWGQVGDDKLGDLSSLADVCRKDGKKAIKRFIFGEDAWNEFLIDEAVQAALDNRRINLGEISMPQDMGEEGKFHGRIAIGSYIFELWTYTGEYEHPETGVITPYMDPGKVIALPEKIRLDATFGGIPNIGRELGINGPGLLPELGGRIASSAAGMDLHPNVWITADGETLQAGVGARPLLIPTAIDQYGCLDTGL